MPCLDLDSTEKSGGMAFEVLLKPATADSPRLVRNATPTDRRISLELIDKKLKEAQGRREVGASALPLVVSFVHGCYGSQTFFQMYCLFCPCTAWRFGVAVTASVAYQRSYRYSTSSPVSTEVADCLRAGIPPRYVTSHPGQVNLLLSARWEMSTGQSEIR